MFAQANDTREMAMLRRRQPSATEKPEHTVESKLQYHHLRRYVLSKQYTYEELQAICVPDDEEAACAADDKKKAKPESLEVAIEIEEKYDGVAKNEMASAIKTLCVMLERNVLGATTMDGLKH